MLKMGDFNYNLENLVESPSQGYESQTISKEKKGFFKRTFKGGVAFMTSLGVSDAIYTSMMERKIGQKLLEEYGMNYEANILAQNLLDTFGNQEVALLYQKAPLMAFAVGTAMVFDKFPELNKNSGITTKFLNTIGVNKGKDILYAAGAYWSVGVAVNLYNYFYTLNFNF